MAAVGVQRLDDEHKQYGASAPNLLTQLMPTAVYKLCLYVGAVSNVERKKEKKEPIHISRASGGNNGDKASSLSLA